MAKKPEEDTQGRVYIYGRVSTNIQETSESIQGASTRKYIADHLGGRIDRAFFDTDVSGKTPIRSRPQGGEMMALLRPNDNIVIARLDRGFRSLKDVVDFIDFAERRKVRIHIVNFHRGQAIDISSPIGRAMIQTLAVWSEFERALIIERCTEGLKRSAAIGMFRPQPNKLPYGFKFIKTGEIKNSRGYMSPVYAKVPDPEQHKMFDALSKCLLAANYSAPKAAYRMNLLGIKTPNKGIWNEAKVLRAMRSYSKYIKAIEAQNEFSVGKSTGLTRSRGPRGTDPTGKDHDPK